MTAATTQLRLEGLAGLLSELQGEYESVRPKSRAIYESALGSLPGGNSRSQLYFEPFPFYVDSAEGALVTDVDGFQYLDLVNNYTSLVHGHLTDEMRRRLVDQVSKGMAFGAPTELEVRLADMLVERIPSVDQVRFANSGTEACLYAVRTARRFTGRHDIIKTEGGYNGGFESAQVSVKHISDQPNESVVEPGIHPEYAAATHIIPFNDAERAVAIIEEHGPRSAALIIEPMQGSAGAIAPDPGYLEALRDATRRTGCLLIFDEVMTLRLGYGGLQEELGIIPDLTAMGKIVGGGTPVGAFGGRADIMAVTDPRTPDSLMHAGTFNANPFTMAAGVMTLEMFTREAAAEINERGDELRAWLNTSLGEHGLPMVATGFGNAVQLHAGTTPPRSFRDSKDLPKLPLQVLFLSLLADGVFAAPNRLLMTISTAVGDDEIAKVKESFERGFDLLRRGGFREVAGT